MIAPEVRKKLLITADDFGISEAANRNILDLLKMGKLDRVEIMIDGFRLPNQEEIAVLLSSEAALDVHLNAIQKVTPSRKLVEPVFPRLVNFLKRLIKGDIRSEVMEKKWKEEIEIFHKIFGKKPDGVSAHQHTHFFPGYFRAVLRLAKEFQISYIRFGKSGMIKSSSNVFRILNFLHKRNQKYFDRSGIKSADFWVSLDWFQDLGTLLKNIPEGKTEIIFHPERIEEFEIIKKYF